MSKKINLLNTQVKKPDGSWLGGDSLGFGGGSNVTKQTVKDWGFAERSEVTEIINVKETFNIDNTGTVDVADDIQNILDYYANKYVYPTLYFPKGIYLLSHGLVIKCNLTIRGERGVRIGEDYGSRYEDTTFKLQNGVSNVNIFSVDESRRYNITSFENFRISSSAYHVNQISEVNNERYEVTETAENINGIVLNYEGYNSKISNVSVIGCSGYGIVTSVFADIENCKVSHCKTAYSVETDTTLNNCNAMYCGTGADLSANNYYARTVVCARLISCRFEGLAENGVVMGSNYRCQIIGLMCGRIYKAGIKFVGDCRSSYIQGDLSRCAQMQAGTNVSDVTNYTGACAIEISNGLVSNNEFHITINSDTLNDYAASTKLTPSLAFALSTTSSSIAFTQNEIFLAGTFITAIASTTDLDKIIKSVGDYKAGDLRFYINNINVYMKSVRNNIYSYVEINGLVAYPHTSPIYISTWRVGTFYQHSSGLYMCTKIANYSSQTTYTDRWTKLT